MPDTTSAVTTHTRALPVLPLRDVVVYPNMVIPLFVGRERSMRALEAAMEGERQLVLVAQKDPQTDDPNHDELYEVGTLVNVLQLLKLPDDTVKVLVEGEERVLIDGWDTDASYLAADVSPLDSDYGNNQRELDVMARTLMSLFEQLVKQSSKLPPEVLSTLSGIEDQSRLADSVAAHLSVKLSDKQAILETLSVARRLEHLIGLVDSEMDLQKVEKRIRGRVKSQMEKSQREYYLNEQMKAIQKELGDSGEGSDIEQLEKKIKQADMPEEVQAKAEEELKKLKSMSPMSAEASVVRNYLDWLIAVPWSISSDVSHDLEQAEKTLNADHYGLEKVKERILEYLAVQKRVKSLNGPILCLVGPPGVGKTSLGQSIADATNRKFVRMSLGGVRDEAEIRGHRRTYIGSMPGRIVQNLKKCGTNNPLYMLDEIDKMAMDFRGDPASALLEVLDPEQNKAFNDHYLEVDVDLSRIMWIATANSLAIPDALRDRMEIIRLPGYTEEEKLAIAKKYLIPKQRKNNGLNSKEIRISEGAVRHIIRYYTREAGVRNLEREIANLCRKAVRKLAASGAPTANGKQAGKSTQAGMVKIDTRNLDDFLGVRRFDFGRKAVRNEVGLVTGLAWTQVGGDLLSIECSIMPGKGKLVHTGQLGDVMKESIVAAQSVVRARSERLGIAPDFHDKQDVHIHVPEGATPKDGPSAGIGMCTALVSALTGIAVRSDVAMTGEITLRGRVLPIGGLKEKLLAAHRGGIKTVIIPDENEKDLADIPKNVTAALDIKPVRWIDEVLDLALEHPIKPKKDAKLTVPAAQSQPKSDHSENAPAAPH